MAAVAGSKGRLQARPASSPTLQRDVAVALLEGAISPAEAAGRLAGQARIREVGVDTNMICNLACRYCYLEDRAEEPGAVPLDALGDRLGRLVDGGAKLIAFIGKEPLADDRAPRLLGRLHGLRASGRRFRTGLVTNGTLVRRWLDRLVEAELSYIDISVDGLGDWENRLRGRDVAARIHEGVDAVVGSPLRDRFATATVLTDTNAQTYAAFVSAMFDRGVPTCFASPVLRFAMSNEVADLALGLDRVLALADQIAARTQDAGPDAQAILDLPYRYSWELLRSGRIPPGEIEEDAFEALHWRSPGSSVFIKLNPFPYSYWRAFRITHDGRIILDMDLAAHARYKTVSRPLTDLDLPDTELFGGAARPFLRDFIERHVVGELVEAHERGLAAQFERNLVGRTAA